MTVQAVTSFAPDGRIVALVPPAGLPRCDCGCVDLVVDRTSETGWACMFCGTTRGEVTPCATTSAATAGRTAAETSFPAPSGSAGTPHSPSVAVLPVRDDEQADVSPESGRPARNLNHAPLRLITHREVMASRTRLFLECGHAVERAYTGWQHLARCADCMAEGRS